MRSNVIAVVSWLATVLPAAALGVGADLPEPSPRTVYLVSHGWHAGIVLRRADVTEEAWPELRDFPHAEYLEIGWGDRAFYQTPEPHVGHALQAALLPTPSVLHLVGFRGAVSDYFPASEVVALRVSAEGLDRLARHIATSHAREGPGPAPSLGSGLYGDSRFYASRETYHLFNTCNPWTARALREAGLPFDPGRVGTVEGLMGQARALAGE